MNLDNTNIWENLVKILSLAFAAISAYAGIKQQRKEKEEIKEKKEEKEVKEKIRNEKKEEKQDPFNMNTSVDNNRKLSKDRIFMIIAITILSCALIMSWWLPKRETPNTQEKALQDPIKLSVQNKEPLLVFAGGGSVRNMLHQEFEVDVRKQSNSINIAIASGSAWRVLAEEYHMKDDDSLHKFITICLSADTMSGDFYSEYMSQMNNTIIAAVYLGDDNLVPCISNGILRKWNKWNDDTISSKNLAHIIQDIIVSNQEIEIDNEPRKVRIFTTNKTSGTLELYKKSLNDYFHLEEMRDNNNTSIFYDNMDPEKVNTYSSNDTPLKTPINRDREFIILGSQYYMVDSLSKSLYKPLSLVDSSGIAINKPMYLYFLADKVSANRYKINDSILVFLQKLDDSGKLPKKKQSNWDRIIQSGIIDYDLSNKPYMYIERIN